MSLHLRLEMAGRLDAVLRCLGYALWQLQELETAIATCVVVRLRDSRGVGTVAGTAISASVEKRTLGQLLHELSGAGVLTDDQVARLRDLLEDRNWLVHRSRRDHRGILTDDIELRALVERLEGVSERTLVLLKEVGAEIERYVVSTGVPQELIDREAARLVESWEEPA